MTHLPPLVKKVLSSRGGHHKVVFHGHRKTLANSVALIAPSSLRQCARGRLVGNPGSKPLIKAVAVPRELGVWIRQILVRQNHCGKRAVGAVRDEPIDPVRKVVVHTLQHGGKVQTPVALEALRIELYVSCVRTCAQPASRFNLSLIKDQQEESSQTQCGIIP